MMATRLYVWVELSGRMASLLQDEAAGDLQGDFVAHQRQILLDAEVAAPDLADRFESDVEGFVHRVCARADQTGLQGDLLGDAVKRELAGDGRGVRRRGGDLRRNERGVWILRRIEPLIRFQHVVEDLGRRQDRGRGDRYLEPGGGGGRGIDQQRARSAGEEAGEIGEAEVRDRKGDLSV